MTRDETGADPAEPTAPRGPDAGASGAARSDTAGSAVGIHGSGVPEIPPSERLATPIVRARAGLLVAAVLLILCAVLGSFIARQFGLGLRWSAVISLVVAIALGALLAKLSAFAYFALAALITALLGYLVFDFTHSVLEAAKPYAGLWAALAIGLVGFALYDFRRLKREARLWVEAARLWIETKVRPRM